ncbi:uncharacterized protein MELLADRAFT_111899 [Melampsora larici-populina 98AG31]|uniref:Uncharacterized protein n=1 Tax=Melampsora larici-populina (strain 98AG31 / pathotype 3-4-7) TaxID=747676 RepID=F4S4R0_MELLP|nr:uncharacterized protein MELLADRAFT_111899 [Melampsora larici-populina 98AG31]EGG00334.1 hypothetical protein MELLADRAFT_111899 [Melampsora larici-populina 98AG31]
MPMEPLRPMPMFKPVESLRLSKFGPTLQHMQIKGEKYKTWLITACVVVLIFSYRLFLPSSKDENLTGAFQRTRITHMASIGKKPIEELPSCGKTMLYLFAGASGLGSELSLYTEAAAVATWLNYTMLVDDTRWNYGRLSDYFDIPPLKCRPPSNWREMPRTLFSNLGKKESDHVWLDREHPDGYTSHVLQQVDSRAIDTHAVWNMINHREQRTILPAEQNLHYSVKPIFDAKSDAFRHIWKPNQMILDEVMKLKVELNDKLLALQNKTSHRTSTADFDLDSPMARKVISIQFRLGDKIDENMGWKTAGLSGVKSAQSNPRPYLEIAKSYVPDWKTSKELPALFILSDDPEAALKKFEEHQSFYPASQRFPLIVSPKGISIAEHGHLQSSFNTAPLEVRKTLAVALIRDITFAVDNSESIVCSSSSNLCNTMFHLRGPQDLIGSAGSCRSVDIRWHPTGIAHSFNNLSLDAVKDREKILAMMPRLATDPKNYIEL